MRNSALACVVGLAGLFGAGTISTPAEAQSLACGGTYTIQRGDTLQKVTRMAYGEGLSYNFIYPANQHVVGPNPPQIEVGMVIRVPCRNGQTPGVTRSSAVVRFSTTSSASSAVSVSGSSPARRG